MIALLSLLLAAAGTTGHVVEVTPGRAYLDRGSTHGLTTGMVLELVRGARRIGSCRVESLAPHHATCVGAAAREGDRFEIAVRVPPAPEPARLAPVLPARVVLERNAAVRAAPAPVVVDRATPFAPSFGRSLLEARLGHASFTTFDAADGTFHEERVDVVLRGVDTFSGFRFHGDLTAIGYAARPQALTTFRPGATALLFVHQAELSNRDARQPVVLSMGRVWPQHTPGVSTFDGAQAGARIRGGAIEVGAYGGGLPAPDTLEPTFASWTGGVYVMGERTGQSGLFSWMRLSGRAGAVHVAGIGSRAEAELSTLVVPARRVDLSAAIRVQAGDGLDAPGIGAARAELGVRPTEVVRLSGGVRFLDREAAAVELAQLTGSAASVSSTRHADLAIAWDVSPVVSVGASGGVGQDVTRGWVRRWAGPEITFPRALFGRGSVGLGYQEELGSASGRSAWTQASLVASEDASVFARVSYFEDTAKGPGAPTLREAGLMTGTSIRIVEGLDLSASVLVRPSIPDPGSEVSQLPVGVLGDVGLRGRF